MSKEYDAYIKEHCNNVQKAFWCLENYINNHKMMVSIWNTICIHDGSKHFSDEYNAYDNYFYNKSESNEEEFMAAWLRHIHRNPHHWEHWLLIDDEHPQPKALEMPYNYVIEMVCDWMSFGIKNDNPKQVIYWYNQNQDKMILHENTRKLVEDILEYILKTDFDEPLKLYSKKERLLI